MDGFFHGQLTGHRLPQKNRRLVGRLDCSTCLAGSRYPAVMKYWIVSGAVLGGVAVAMGSFGAHGLKGTLEASGQAANWETAVRYAVFHALALLVVGAISGLPQASTAHGWLSRAGWAFLAGTLIFSGCLAVLALSGMRWLGAIVPLGGVLFLVGWVCLAIAGLACGGAQTDSA
jgi:uncharacterized membrane protein YgdD (TMEM256/DUF423 family)